VQSLSSLRREVPAGLHRTSTQTFPMRSGQLSQTLVASGGAAAFVRPGGAAPAAPSDLTNASDDLALAPEHILLTALDAADLAARHDSTLGGIRCHIIEFGLEGARVRLAIDAGTWLPERVLLVRAFPSLVYWAMWGDVRIETTWSSWALETRGIWYPRQRTVTFNGEPFREYAVTALELGAPAPADSFAIPDSTRVQFVAASAPLRPSPDPPLTPLPISDGIVLMQGGYQATLVRQRAGVVVLEAPESEAKSRAVLAEADRLFPGRPVTSVVTTSPLWMHIAGLREYARRGIPIYALDVNEPLVRRLLASPHSLERDTGSQPRVPVRLRPVHDAAVLGDGDNRMVLIPALGIHASAMMLVYWPARRLLYASDMTIPPTFEPIFTAAYSAELKQTIDRLHLSVDRVFALHLSPFAWPPRGADAPRESRQSESRK
jgi:glyoxylase-like metal-dependent hydrolase (beta-lactamase superfamily II)